MACDRVHKEYTLKIMFANGLPGNSDPGMIWASTLIGTIVPVVAHMNPAGRVYIVANNSDSNNNHTGTFVPQTYTYVSHHQPHREDEKMRTSHAMTAQQKENIAVRRNHQSGTLG